MNKQHTQISKSNNSQSMVMSNTQENYNAHWLIRFPDYLIADVLDSDQLQEIENFSKRDFIALVVSALSEKLNLSLNVSDYDFNAMKSREQMREKQAAKADTTPALDEQIKKAILEAYKNGASAQDIAKVMREKYKYDDATIYKYLPEIAPKTETISFI